MKTISHRCRPGGQPRERSEPERLAVSTPNQATETLRCGTQLRTVPTCMRFEAARGPRSTLSTPAGSRILLPLLQTVPALRAAHLLRGSHANRRLQMERNQRLRRNLHLLSFSNPIHAGPQTAAAGGPNSRAFAAAQQAAENGSNRSPAAGLKRRILAPAGALLVVMRRSPHPPDGPPYRCASTR